MRNEAEQVADLDHCANEVKNGSKRCDQFQVLEVERGRMLLKVVTEFS